MIGTQISERNDAQEPDDVIDEFPMEARDFDVALAPWLTRKDRRRFWRALKDAELIVFNE